MYMCNHPHKQWRGAFPKPHEILGKQTPVFGKMGKNLGAKNAYGAISAGRAGCGGAKPSQLPKVVDSNLTVLGNFWERLSCCFYSSFSLFFPYSHKKEERVKKEPAPWSAGPGIGKREILGKMGKKL